MSSGTNNSFTPGCSPDFNNMKWDNIGFLQIRYTDVPGKFRASYLLKDNDEHPEKVFREGIGLDDTC